MRRISRNAPTPFLTVRQLDNQDLIRPLLWEPVPLLPRHIPRLDHVSFTPKFPISRRDPMLEGHKVHRVNGAPLRHNEGIPPDDFERSPDAVCRVARAEVWTIGLQRDVFHLQHRCGHGDDNRPNMADIPLEAFECKITVDASGRPRRFFIFLAVDYERSVNEHNDKFDTSTSGIPFGAGDVSDLMSKVKGSVAFLYCVGSFLAAEVGRRRKDAFAMATFEAPVRFFTKDMTSTRSQSSAAVSEKY